MLDTIQKKSNAEKNSIENNMKLNINNLEQKYQKQVKDIQDSHSRIYSELINNNKELEKEIKILRAENEAQKNKKTNNTELNKKIDEINQEKEKYKKLQDSIKNEKDKQFIELNNNFNKEKEALKKKIAEIEKNLREAEGKRGVLLLESEKEKAKWDIEKDNLMTKCQELNDKIASLEKKNENLLRENEKLKNEKNMLRTRSFNKSDFKFGSHLGSSTVGTRKYDYSTSYNNAMIKALDTTNDSNRNIDEKEEIKEIKEVKETTNEKPVIKTTTGAKGTTTTTSTTKTTKTVVEKKEVNRKKK
jgi:hypothetical protein